MEPTPSEEETVALVASPKNALGRLRLPFGDLSGDIPPPSLRLQSLPPYFRVSAPSPCSLRLTQPAITPPAEAPGAKKRGRIFEITWGEADTSPNLQTGEGSPPLRPAPSAASSSLSLLPLSRAAPSGPSAVAGAAASAARVPFYPLSGSLGEDPSVDISGGSLAAFYELLVRPSRLIRCPTCECPGGGACVLNSHRPQIESCLDDF